MLSIQGVTAPAKVERFDAAEFIAKKLSGLVKDGDVIVVSSKFLAIAEGRVVKLSGVRVSTKARELARKYKMDPRLCELVVRESDLVIGGVPGFLLTSKDGLLTPNAGIDKSNVRHGTVVLYPRRPAESASMVRDAVKFTSGASVGVVVCDSRLSPTRRGTTGVALATSGLESVLDLRGREDLFGNVLKVTSQAVADDLSSAAELLMGESDEATPIVLVRGLRKDVLKETEYQPERFAISIYDCVYMRSLDYKPNTLLGISVSAMN